jgi:hypothetical protein
MTFWDWLAANWGWVFLGFMIFGGTFFELFAGVLQALFNRHSRVSKLKARIAAKNAELASKNEELRRAHELITAMGVGRELTATPYEASATAARMARLLGLVQGADTAWPQLADDVRSQIDLELRAYHTVPVPKALKPSRKSTR